MDTISMLLTGWVIFIILSIILVKYLYIRFVKKSGFPPFETVSETNSTVNLSSDQQHASSSTSSVATRLVESITGVKTVISSSPQVQSRRKRLEKSKSSEEVSGVCSGPDLAVVEFANEVCNWAFKPPTGESRPWAKVKELFISSLNQMLSSENDFKISITDLDLKDDVKLYNMFAECVHPDNVKVTSDCELQLNGEVSFSQKPGETRKCSFFVDRIAGRLSCLMNADDNSAIVKLDGWPDISVGVKDEGAAVDELIGDAIASAIRSSVTEIDYSSFTNFPVMPKCSPTEKSGEDNIYLLVTVVRAKDLGLQKGCQEAYCIIELDDPPQRYQTDAVKSHDPVWNENFVFTVSPGGGELLFEVHDKVGARFLGCNIISVDEIKTGKADTMKLKSRKMEESDQYTGSIDVQFTHLSESEFLKRKMKNKSGQTDKSEGDSVPIPNSQYGEERGRRKTRKGDIFTTIRRRFSKGRSHSVMAAENANGVAENGDDSTVPRSVSADRQSMASRLGMGSARSSTSELSGVSGFSTTTFVHENSTLVIESMENRVKKYFLVPPNLAESGKYKKRGKKLHIYNDHTFIAKHMPGGSVCEICTSRLPFSIGKQGYYCRDCHMICHKECHVRAPSFCPKTTIYDIELISVKQLETKPATARGGFASLFSKKGVSNKVVAAENENAPTTEAYNEPDIKPKKKKSNIFRKVTRLGKISEEKENAESKEGLVEDQAAESKEANNIAEADKEKGADSNVDKNGAPETNNKDTPSTSSPSAEEAAVTPATDQK